MDETKSNISAMMRQFYQQGWCSGSGGGISVRVGDTYVMAPSGVEKEKLEIPDFFELDLEFNPTHTPPHKLTECFPIFRTIYRARNAYGVLHSHALSIVMSSMIANEKLVNNEIRITDQEMLKGIRGHKNTDTLVVPIIENTERESELTERIKNALKIYPRTYAIIVRNHGMYVWGDTVVQTKLHAETYHYLLDLYTRINRYSYTNPVKLQPNTWLVDSDLVSESHTSESHTSESHTSESHTSESHTKESHNRQMPETNLPPYWLARNGVLYFDCPTEENAMLTAKRFGVISTDKICIDHLTDTVKFFENHYHEDYELRYIKKGSGYFDILDKLTNQWVRIQVVPGSLLYIPARQIHRFTPDTDRFIVALRMFSTAEPVWTPINV